MTARKGCAVVARRRTRCAAAAIGVIWLVAASPAPAATTIGQTVFAAESCSGPATLLQEAAGASPTYSVPPGGGVITSWTHLESGSGGNIKLAVFRHAGGAPTQYTTVGASDAVTLAAGPNSFLTRVPVREGDTIGMLVISGGVGCTFMTSNAGDVANRDSAAVHDVGSTHTYTEQSPTPRRINVQADVEPDCDNDGFGDETQDPVLFGGTCPPRGRTLTLDANKNKVKKGKKVTLSGRVTELTGQGECQASQAVQLQRKKPKKTSFTTIEQLQTDATGGFSANEKVKKTFEYRAEVAETATCGGGLSNTEKVKIKKPK